MDIRLAEQLLRARASDIGDRALRSCAALYFEHEPGKVKFLATSIILSVGPATFLLTAGHVLDEFIGKPVYAAGNEVLVSIGGEWRHSRPPSNKRDSDAADLAVLDLPRDQFDRLNLQAFTTSDANPAHEPDRRPLVGTYYLAVGFPTSRQSTWSREGELPAPRPMYLALRPGPPPERIDTKFRPDWNISMEFDKADGVGRDGNPMTMPDPVGLSGGAILAIQGLTGPAPIDHGLVALSIAWRRDANAIIGTRIGLCFNAIAELRPELERLLPWPTPRS